MNASSKTPMRSVVTNYRTTVSVAAHRVSSLVDELDRRAPGDGSSDRPRLRLLRAAAERSDRVIERRSVVTAIAPNAAADGGGASATKRERAA